MYTEYYNAIESRIKQGLNSVKTVDFYNAQYQRYQELKANSFPAVYVEFDNPITWKTQGNGLQTADTVIKLHMVVKDIADSPAAALGLASDLSKLFHLHSLSDTKQLSTELCRSETSLETEYDQLKVVVISFVTSLADYSFEESGTNTTVTLDLSQK
jgi:hypothetical protein